MPQKRTLLRPQIPHYRDMLSSCAPDPFGMTDEFEAPGKCDSPAFLGQSVRIWGQSLHDGLSHRSKIVPTVSIGGDERAVLGH